MVCLPLQVQRTVIVAKAYALTYKVDGVTYETNNYFDGDDLSLVDAPTAPVKTGYTFTGWDLATPSTMPSNDVVINAVFAVNTHSLAFTDYNDDILFTQNYDYNTNLSGVTLPSNPTRTGYTFTNWSDTVPATMPDNDVTINAAYTINQYTATFKDFDGTTLSTSTVDYLQAAIEPANPTKVGYTFSGWDKSFSSLSEDIIVTATYSINSYKLSFIDHDNTLLATTHDYNADLSGVIEPTSPTRVGYTFIAFNTSVPATMPDNDVTIKATYTINQYTATFKDFDGSTLSTSTIDYLTGATAPASPSRVGYTFSGWDKAFNSITQDVIVTALYTINQYTATFKDLYNKFYYLQLS